MKKLLGILVLGLLLSGCYTATVEETVGGQFQRLNKGMSKIQVRDVFNSVIPADDPFAGGGSNCRLEYIRDKKLEILSSASRNYHFVFENVTIPKVGCHHQKTIGNGIFYSAHNTLAAAQNTVSNYKSTAEEAIMFTIKDKREQCEAIGFKPETEKFADCVLRLVELDVKQQTQNQIAVAQNNGNDALVKQLKRQSDLQSSQALIDLGQQLMNPKRYNSNIYMPQTQRCTMQGFGTFATMRCR